MTKSNSVVVYHGPSRLDGAPIVAILSGFKTPSQNRKTGPMLQLWILREDVSPTAAQRTGADESICGDCPLRHFLGGGCYVNVGQAPESVWRAYKRGNVPVLPLADVPQAVAGEPVRLGAYGDPAALPIEVLQALTATAKMHTGYTHQWRNVGPEYAALLMASTDTVADRMAATALGWRYFGLANDVADGGATGDAIECLSDARDIPCVDCGLCAGNTRSGAKSILITPHGSRSKRAAATASA